MTSNLQASNYSNRMNVSQNQFSRSPSLSLSLMIQPKLLQEDPRKNLLKEMNQQRNIFQKQQQLRSNSQNEQSKLPEINFGQTQQISKSDQIFNILNKIPIQTINDSFQFPLISQETALQQLQANYPQQNQERELKKGEDLMVNFEDQKQLELSERENEMICEEKEENQEELNEIERDQINFKSEEVPAFKPTKKQFRIKKIKYNKQQIEDNFIQTKQLFEETSLKQPFFKITNDKITLLIVKFLNGKDLIKLATVSKESRWTISYSLQKTSYFKEIEQDQVLFRSKYGIYDPTFRIQRRQDEFQEFLKNGLQELEIAIQNFRKRNFPNKEAILFILAAGIQSTRNQLIPDLDVISYIKKNGIQQSFSGIMMNFFPQLNIEINLPDFPDDKRSIKLLQFTKLIYNYVRDRKANQLSIQIQKKAFYQITLMKQRELFMKMKSKIMPVYSKSIMRFGKESKLVTMMNKNIFQTILSFLKISEISVLLQSGKTMRSFVQISLESKVETLKIQIKKSLEQNNISSGLAQALKYHKNLQQFQNEQNGILRGNKLYSLHLRDLFKAITFSVSSKEIGEFNILFNQNFERSTFKFAIEKIAPNPKKMQLIHSFLESNTTLHSFKEKLSCYDQQTKRDCTLLYLGMKSFLIILELKLTTKELIKRDMIYSQQTLGLEIMMIHYQKLLGINVNDESLAFTTKRIDNYTVKQCKAAKRQQNVGGGGVFSLQ